MGSITIFTIENCPHSKQAKSAMDEWRIPYAEISLSEHSQKYKDLLRLTGGQHVSAPQVFCNSQHIGGVDDCLRYLRNFCSTSNCWASARSTAKLESSLQDQLLEGKLKRKSSRKNLKDAQQPSRLMIPITEEEVEETSLEFERGEGEHDCAGAHVDKANSSRIYFHSQQIIEAPDGSRMSILETTELLKQILQYGKRRWNFTSYKACCTGEELVDSLVQHYAVSRDVATEFGRMLHHYNVIWHVCNDHDFQDHPGLFFRLQCYHTPHILNSYQIWHIDAPYPSSTILPLLCLPNDPESVLKRGMALFSKVEKAVLGHDGNINYRNAFWCSDLPVFESAICELQAVNLSNLKGASMMVCVRLCNARYGIASSIIFCSLLLLCLLQSRRLA